MNSELKKVKEYLESKGLDIEIENDDTIKFIKGFLSEGPNNYVTFYEDEYDGEKIIELEWTNDREIIDLADDSDEMIWKFKLNGLF